MTRAWLGFLLGLLLSSTPASAQDARAQARKHFRTGMAAYTVERYEDAIRAFQEGFLLEPDPIFLFNIGQAYRLSNQPDKAIASYEKYLQLKPNAQNRADVEDHISELRRQIEAPKRPPREVIAPETSTHSPAQSAPADSGGESASTPRVPTPEQVTPPPAAPESTTPPLAPEAKESRRIWPVWIGIAAGVVAVVAAVSIISFAARPTEPSCVADLMDSVTCRK